jgi:hypothetical protein
MSKTSNHAKLETLAIWIDAMKKKGVIKKSKKQTQPDWLREIYNAKQ